MPKQLINVIGLIVSLGIIALGITAVALPLFLQAVTVGDQTATVASSNAVYQSQVDQLRAEEERFAEIEASVSALQQQIPAVNQQDDIFEVVARAATDTGVEIQSVTAGSAAAFVGDAAPTAVAPATEEQPATEGGADAAALSGRQQIDFAIQVTAVDMAQATAFLDALRSGPRLLHSISASTTVDDESVIVQVSALTFVDSKG